MTVGGLTHALDKANGVRSNIGDLYLDAMAKISAGDETKIGMRVAANVDQTLTNAEMIAVGLQIAAQVDALYKASWVIKDGGNIPADYAPDEHWQ